MKKQLIYLLLSLIFLSSCTRRVSETSTDQVTDYDLLKAKQTELLTDCELIGRQLRQEDDFEELFSFLIVETVEYTINGKKGKIIIERVDTWYHPDFGKVEWDDPGDFHRIRVKTNDTIFSFFNEFGWIRPEYKRSYFSPSFFEHTPSFPSYNKVQSEYIILTKNGDNLLLFAFHWPFPSDPPGFFSIINLSLKKPRLLFNDNYLLSSFQEDNPKITVTKFFKDEGINQHDTLILRNGCLRRR